MAEKSRTDIMVLHDFDNAFPSGTRSLRRSWKLSLYALSKKLPLLKRYSKDVRQENRDMAVTLAKLDALVGVVSRFGINTRVAPEFPELKDELRSLGAIVHDHWHVSTGKNWDVRRDPPLPFTVDYEHRIFDQKYAKERAVTPKDVLVFHADYPDFLPLYIDALYQLIEKKDD